MQYDLLIAVLVLGALLLAGIGFLIVDLVRTRPRSEADLIELHKRKVDAYTEISAALQQLQGNPDAGSLLDLVSKHLPTLDREVVRWLNLIIFGIKYDYGFDVFLGYLKQLSSERAAQFAKVEKFWTADLKNQIVLALNIDAINAMRRDLHLKEVSNIPEIVSAELTEIEQIAA